MTTSATATTEIDWVISLASELDETLVLITDHGVQNAWVAQTDDRIQITRLDGSLFIDGLGDEDWVEIDLSDADADSQRDAVLAVIREGR